MSVTFGPKLIVCQSYFLMVTLLNVNQINDIWHIISLNSTLNMWKDLTSMCFFSPAQLLKKCSVWLTTVKITTEVWMEKHLRLCIQIALSTFKFSLHCKEIESRNCKWYIIDVLLTKNHSAEIPTAGGYLVGKKIYI